MRKIGREFYLRPALESVTDFLGRVLVRQTPQGRISGVVTDVEAYPAFVDKVHHGNKKTPRTEVMWREGGYAYIYLIYGTWNQFAAVVNVKDIPDVVFIRGVAPLEGREIMYKQWDKSTKDEKLSNSPGKLCKSFLISKKLYGVDLTGDELFLEDWGIKISNDQVQAAKRVGISPKHVGYDNPLRYFVKSLVKVREQLRRVR